MRTSLGGRVVAVTGAGSGIGRALALESARRGARLALSDVDPAGLEATVAAVRALGAEASGDVVDVSDRAAVVAWADAVAARWGRVDVAVANAGVSVTGDFLNLTYDDLDWIVGVNLEGVVSTVKELLPHLVAAGTRQRPSHLVVMSSLFGLVSVPGQSAYHLTKYAVRGLAESVREEMLVAGHPVSVTVVHPGGVATGIARHGRTAVGVDPEGVVRAFDRMARTTPERAATLILDGMLRRRGRVLVGADAHVVHQLARLAGWRYQDVTARLSRPARARLTTPADR